MRAGVAQGIFDHDHVVDLNDFVFLSPCIAVAVWRIEDGFDEGVWRCTTEHCQIKFTFFEHLEHVLVRGGHGDPWRIAPLCHVRGFKGQPLVVLGLNAVLLQQHASEPCDCGDRVRAHPDAFALDVAGFLLTELGVVHQVGMLIATHHHARQ